MEDSPHKHPAMSLKMKCLPLLLAVLTLSSLTALAGSGKWLTDLEEAKKIAAKENKAILIDFTGSDWCHWCIKLKEEVFSLDEFTAEAGKQFVLVELDFPHKSDQSEETKKKNKAIAKKYKVRGFPTVLLTDAAGNPFGRTGYLEGGVKPYLKHLKKLLEQKDMD